MADDTVCKILEEWGLEVLIDSFKDNAIDEDVFNNMNNDLISKLIPVLGYQFKFMRKYKLYKSLSDTACEQSAHEKFACENEENIVTNTLQNEALLKNLTPDNIVNLQIINESDIPVASTSGVISQIIEIPSSSDLSISSISSASQDLEKEEFEQFLNSTFSGRVALALYKKSGDINVGLLVDAVIKHEILLERDYKIKKNRFLYLANKLAASFPEEKECFWYSCINNGKGEVKISGALYNRYLYCRKLLNNSGLLVKEVKKSDSNVLGATLIDNEGNLKWLEDSLGSEDETLKIWNNTYAARSLLNKLTVHEYLKKYKFLQTSNGYLLLISDFDRNYPESKNNFYESWPNIAKLIIEAAKKRKDSDTKNFLLENQSLLNKGHDNVIALLLLPLLLGSTNCKVQKRGQHWKPSKAVVKNGFLLHIATYEELKPYQETRENTYKIYGQTNQPYPMICGPLDNIEAHRIFINDITYILPDILKLIDTCFKIYFALNASYPPECRHVWTFLQQLIYKIEMQKKQQFACVDNLIREIGISNK